MLRTVLLLMVVSAAASGQVSWVKQKPGDPVPKNALLAGTERGEDNDGFLWYVCRAEVRSGMSAGKGGSSLCNLVDGDRGERVASFEIAVTQSPGKWGAPAAAMSGALSAGKANGQEVYVCRGVYISKEGGQSLDRGLHAGKTVGGACMIEFGHNAIALQKYEVYYPGR